MNNIKTTRCIDCSSEFSDSEIEGAFACPSCGGKNVPMATSDDVTIKINWHELRVLGIFAENWARKINEDDPEGKGRHPMTIMCIAERLQKQYPDKTPLTLFSEIRELRKDYEIDTDIDDDSHLGLA